eukprot:CAMPEP_0171481032 /NCGR_PEP_ID=MMETSP0946-20130122/6471_1 /TAXON_ID=109269 /ORGANISM="Vaucheria litorea, Strain CCMP2940" /LENGTH=149 /DNA_ID=CAMNT_0012012461 /DNA_START=362 /DNA_END=808 /DNA_ORIENTATION=-
MVGKVTKCTKSALSVSIGFFEDIYLPSHLLSHPSIYIESQKAWQWLYSEDEKSPIDTKVKSELEVDPDHSYIIQKGDEVRFRVRSVDFHNAVNESARQNIKIKEEAKENVHARRRRSSSVDSTVQSSIPPCMKIIGSTNEDGLGMTSWW